jgi:TetR/AcrR family transcriptional repressor of nem operon
MARQPAAVRRAYTQGVRDAVRRIRELAPAAGSKAHLALLSGMVGALAISRAVDDEALSEAVLRDTRNFRISKMKERR